MHLHFYISVEVIGAGVGSAAAVFLLVIIVALIIGIAAVKSQKKGNVILVFSVDCQMHCDTIYNKT